MKSKKAPSAKKVVNYKTTWNLQLMYKSSKDLQIEKDMKELEVAYEKFAKKWSTNQLFIKEKKVLLQALEDYLMLQDKTSSSKAFAYFYFARDVDSDNGMLAAMLTKITERITTVSNKTLFFCLKLGRLEPKFQKEILKDIAFEKYHYFLEMIFKGSAYQLSEPEEKILSLKYGPAYQSWVDANEKAIGKLSVKWKGKNIPIHQAAGLVLSLPRKDRAKIHSLVMEQYKSISLLAEAELNAIFQDKKINDELRGYEKPYSETVLGYQNTDKEVEQLVKTVSDSYGVSHRLYSLKAKLMGLPKLAMYDRSMGLQGSKMKFTFEQGVDIVRTAFEKVDPKYAAILDSFVENGQIDVYARLGKKGGGYCWGGHNRPTYILLNWTDDLRSVSTLAHEMGHAIHGQLSKSQGVLYEGHPISTAEVASTLFENFVFDELILQLSEKERVYAKYNQIQDFVSTVFRQIASFQAELEMNLRSRKEGFLSDEELCAIRIKHFSNYLGKSVELTKNDGWDWIAHSHIRYFFYVYSYAYGSLISTAIYKKYKKDNSFVNEINTFLSAGESKSPYDIFKSMGIDTSKSSFWKEGIDFIEEEIIKLEKEAKRLKLIK